MFRRKRVLLALFHCHCPTPFYLHKASKFRIEQVHLDKGDIWIYKIPVNPLFNEFLKFGKSWVHSNFQTRLQKNRGPERWFPTKDPQRVTCTRQSESRKQNTMFFCPWNIWKEREACKIISLPPAWRLNVICARMKQGEMHHPARRIELRSHTN